MILTKSSIYGLRAAVLLAGKQDGGYTNIRDLSEQLDLSFHFLTKVLQKLTAAGIIESCKGPNGGVRLNQNPDKISFMDIVFAIEGRLNLNECLLGMRECGDLSPCEMHVKWSGMTRDINVLLEGITLASVYKSDREIPDAKKEGDLTRKPDEKI